MSFEKEYDVVGSIGAGVYGQVYKVQRKSDGMLFAAKRILIKDFSFSPTVKWKFLNILTKSVSVWIEKYISGLSLFS